MNTVYIIHAKDLKSGNQVIVKPFYSTEQIAEDAIQGMLYEDRENGEHWEYHVSPVDVI